jgi:hypothetical protein
MFGTARRTVIDKYANSEQDAESEKQILRSIRGY